MQKIPIFVGKNDNNLRVSELVEQFFFYILALYSSSCILRQKTNIICYITQLYSITNPIAHYVHQRESAFTSGRCIFCLLICNISQRQSKKIENVGNVWFGKAVQLTLTCSLVYSM